MRAPGIMPPALSRTAAARGNSPTASEPVRTGKNRSGQGGSGRVRAGSRGGSPDFWFAWRVAGAVRTAAAAAAAAGLLASLPRCYIGRAHSCHSLLFSAGIYVGIVSSNTILPMTHFFHRPFSDIWISACHLKDYPNPWYFALT